MKYDVKYAMQHGDRCPYCGQVLHVENDVFECGGEGEGICSIWAVIYDFGKTAGRLSRSTLIDVESWIDDWLDGFIGLTWTEVGWDRSLHLRGVRETWGLPAVEAAS